METSASTAFDIDSVMKELDASTGILPVDALRIVQSHREQFIPRLIQSIEQATASVLAGDLPTGNNPFFAIFLLTEFRAQAAWPAILAAISLPEEGAYDLFGDVITETLPSILAVFCADTPDVLDELMTDTSVDDSVRWGAASTYLLLVRDGRMSRADAVQRLRQRLHEFIEEEDVWGVSFVVDELYEFGDSDSLEDIRRAFELDLVDTMLISLKYIETAFSKGEQHYQEYLERCRDTGIDDTVDVLSTWHAFSDYEDDTLLSYPPPDSEVNLTAGDLRHLYETSGPSHSYFSEIIRNQQPRVGRNEPCPCGSGKKFKKCCGAH